MANYKLKCTKCGWSHPEDQYYIKCPTCSGFLEVDIQLGKGEPIDNSFSSIFKFHPVMPYDPLKRDISRFENIPETAVVFAPRLSEKLDVEIYFKDELSMPSGTWKDREGFVSIYRLIINNVSDLFVFSSGNTGTSLARSASIIKGPRIHLVIPELSRRRLATHPQFFDPDYVKLHFFDGSNDECTEHAKKLAGEAGIQVEGGFSNYARREGLKLLGLEIILSWGKKIDWYTQAVAGGIGLYSFFKAYRDLGKADQCPRLLGVQADICAPMVNAWKAGADTLEEKYIPRTVVPSDFVRVLRTRRPVDGYQVLKPMMTKLRGDFVAVSEGEILEGLRMLLLDDYYKEKFHTDGKLVGLEAATALAGIIKSVRSGEIKKGERILLNVSGAAKEGDVKMEWLEGVI